MKNLKSNQKNKNNNCEEEFSENVPLLFDLSKIPEEELRKQYVNFKDIINKK